VEPLAARAARLRPLVIGDRLSDAELLELADRLGGSEVLTVFNWRFERQVAQALLVSLPDGPLRAKVEGALRGAGAYVRVSGRQLSGAERQWLLRGVRGRCSWGWRRRCTSGIGIRG